MNFVCPDCGCEMPTEKKYWITSAGKVMTSAGHGLREYYPIIRDKREYNGKVFYRLIHCCRKCGREIEYEVQEDKE